MYSFKLIHKLEISAHATLLTSTSCNVMVPSSSPTAIALPSGRQHKDVTDFPEIELDSRNEMIAYIKYIQLI